MISSATSARRRARCLRGSTPSPTKVSGQACSGFSGTSFLDHEIRYLVFEPPAAMPGVLLMRRRDRELVACETRPPPRGQARMRRHAQALSRAMRRKNVNEICRLAAARTRAARGSENPRGEIEDDESFPSGGPFPILQPDGKLNGMLRRRKLGCQRNKFHINNRLNQTGLREPEFDWGLRKPDQRAKKQGFPFNEV